MKGEIGVMVAMGAFYTALIVVVITFKLWLFGSLAVSTVKSLSDNCGHRYPVEVYVINGNWFCSEEK